jgi:hypothetical protein
MARKVIPQLWQQPLLQHASVLFTRNGTLREEHTVYLCLGTCTENFGMLELHADIGILTTPETHCLFLNRYVQLKCGFVGEGKVRCLIFQLMDEVITEGLLCITLFRVKFRVKV